MREHASKRILVTGGAGFIGSHLCEYLLARGHDVLCVDNFYTGSKRNIAHLLPHPLFELLRHDITFPLYVEVDQIYNLACPASPVHYQNDPVQTTKTSVHGAINMLGLAKRVGATILQASTSEVYGDPQRHPQPEHYWGNVNPIGVRACYDEGKRCAETLFMDYRRQHGLHIKVARLFNTYGPRMDPLDAGSRPGAGPADDSGVFSVMHGHGLGAAVTARSHLNFVWPGMRFALSAMVGMVWKRLKQHG